MATPFTIEDLKKHLGPGLGLRKAKYLLEVPVPSEGKTLNILCRSTAFPERNVGTVAVFNKGRKYNMRSETAYPGTYDVSVTDDSKMVLRALFDGWLTLVDDSNPGGQSASSYEKTSSFSLGASKNSGQPDYQADVNIWQLGNQGEKIYGYKLQNAFPSSLGIVELDDSDETTLSEFSVTFTYSESIPLSPGGVQSLTSSILGKDAQEIARILGDDEYVNTLQNENVLGHSHAVTSADLAKISKGNGITGLIQAASGLLQSSNITNNNIIQVKEPPLSNEVVKKTIAVVKGINEL